MPVHFCKLLSPRPSFPGDMTPMEAGLMREHAADGTDLARRGAALVVAGQVFDPAARAEAGFRHEIHPMPQVILRSDLHPQPVREGASREA